MLVNLLYKYFLTNIRYKDLWHIPEREPKEAWDCLIIEYNNLAIDSAPVTNEILTTSQDKGDIFEEFHLKKRKLNPLSRSPTSEIERYKTIPEVDSKTNPLDWWKLNQYQFPILSKLAKIY